MLVPYMHSAETKQKQTAKKRRRNQNTEIDELATLLPIKQQATIANGILAKGRTQSIDKLSVLRLTTAYLKFQKFLKNDKSKGTELKHVWAFKMSTHYIIEGFKNEV